MSDDVSIDQFHTIPAWKGLTTEELNVVDDITFTVALKPGQKLFSEGDPGDGLYVIVSGSIEVTIGIDRDARWQIARLEPGACFGEMALLGNQKRVATATAVTPALLLKVPSKQFNSLLKAGNIAALKITANLAHILCQRMSKLMINQARLLKAQRSLPAETQKKLLQIYQQSEGLL